MKTFQKGTITKLEVQLELVKKGYFVFTPINEASKVDFIFVDEFNIYKKVQVKKLRKCATGFTIDLSFNINSKRTSKEDIDYFATIYEHLLYLILIEDVIDRRSVALKQNYSYTQNYNTLDSKDYLI